MDDLPAAEALLVALLFPRILPVDAFPPIFFLCQSRYWEYFSMVMLSVVLVCFCPLGEAMAGVLFLFAGFLADALPAAEAFLGVSPRTLLGVYLSTLSELLGSAETLVVALTPLAADLVAAFFFPLTPLALAAPVGYSASCLRASFPFSRT